MAIGMLPKMFQNILFNTLKYLILRDMLASQTALIKNGLNQLLCLVPYDIVTSEIWELIMPHWLEAIVQDVPSNELPELRMLLW